jgi:hypothetical protein
VTVDEELNLLEEAVRRLKIEYDIYFGGGSKKPPSDTEWRVQSLVKKYSDSGKLSYPQRFRYNTLVQRYAIYSDLWRQKLKIKEEGYRRPQDAMLGIQGMRREQEQAAAAALQSPAAAQPFRVQCADADIDYEAVRSLFNAWLQAKKKAGQAADPNGFDSFKAFVKNKTEQIKGQYRCQRVEYSVELQNGQVRLKAKAKNSS